MDGWSESNAQNRMIRCPILESTFQGKASMQSTYKRLSTRRSESFGVILARREVPTTRQYLTNQGWDSI